MGLIAALEWLGRPYRLTRVDMLGEMRETSFARINARHETPVLITDDHRALTETMAICAWLETRDDERRISFDARSTNADRMRQLIAFINTGFTGAFSPLWTALEMQTPDPDYQQVLRAYGRDSVIERHDKLEAMLTDSRFIVGDSPTLADGVLIGVARWLDHHEVANRNRWPKLSALRERIEQTEAVRFAMSIEAGETPPPSKAFMGHVPLAEVIDQFGK